METLKIYLGLLGMATLLGLSSAAGAACSFDPNVPSGYSAPNGASDLSGQGNYFCGANIGANGQPMTEVTGVVFQKNGDWELPESERITDVNGLVTNTPDYVVEFPQGNGSRCAFAYATTNAVKGTLLNIDGNVDVKDSIACTDGLVNSDEVSLPEPDLVTTTADGCNITLSANTPNGPVTQDDFDLFTASNLDGSIQAVCNAGGITQNECVQGCPGFVDVQSKLESGLCTVSPDGRILITQSGERCAPCLTAAEATATIPGFDTNGLNLCWEYENGVKIDQQDPSLSYYRPHRPVRHETVDTSWSNECYTTTTTINFFGRELTKSVTTCD